MDSHNPKCDKRVAAPLTVEEVEDFTSPAGFVRRRSPPTMLIE